MSETRDKDAAGSGSGATAPDGTSRHGLKRDLHVWEAIGLSVGAMSPALAMSFSGPGVAALVGRGAALSFVFAGVTCCLIGYGYVLLTRKYQHAGQEVAGRAGRGGHEHEVHQRHGPAREHTEPRAE